MNYILNNFDVEFFQLERSMARCQMASRAKTCWRVDNEMPEVPIEECAAHSALAMDAHSHQ
jgi:hypothetical protein